MEYRELGKTGLKVSMIGLGSAGLAMDYGVNAPGEKARLDRKCVQSLIGKALDSGINLFDTAPSYGESEKLLGSNIRSRDCYIATKVNISRGDEDCVKSIRTSIENSLKNLKREYLDILQIHNAIVEDIGRFEIMEILVRLKKEGLIRFIGASVYEPENATAVIRAGYFDVLQIAYNLLDQRMGESVLDNARAQGVGILGRSVYLKGVLTERVKYFPENCSVLKKAAENIKRRMGLDSWSELSHFAIRFALSNPRIGSVLLGVRNDIELNLAIAAIEAGVLANHELETSYCLRMDDRFWLNPSNWGID